MTERDERFMRQALAVAWAVLKLGEMPIGAVVVVDDEVVASSTSESERPVGCSLTPTYSLFRLLSRPPLAGGNVRPCT